MREDSAAARARFVSARVARLATVGADGRPHLVPITFALTGSTICTAVDAKPKTTTALRRLVNIAANPQVSVLVDHYDEDWARLWWARADGRARVLIPGDPAVEGAIAALARRYAHYRAVPPPGPVVLIDVARWTGWSAEP